MKKEDEVLFSAQMHELADKFALTAQTPVPGCCPPGNKCVAVDPKAADEFNLLSKEIYSKFKDAGYSDDEWNSLMHNSGAGKRMGLSPD